MAPTIYLIEVALEDVLYRRTWSDPGGEQGVWTPLINHKAFGFLSNTGPDPLKNQRLTKPAFDLRLSAARQLHVTAI